MKKESGITLIALIITVIILLILAGVAIASLGNSGLFSKSKDAVNKYTDAQKNEEAELANYLNELENQGKPSPEGPLVFIPIYTREDLSKVASGEQGYIIQGHSYNMNKNAKYKIMQDIDLVNYTISSIPLLENGGEIEGQNNKITNYKSNAPLITDNNGEIKNLIFANSEVTGDAVILRNNYGKFIDSGTENNLVNNMSVSFNHAEIETDKETNIYENMSTGKITNRGTMYIHYNRGSVQNYGSLTIDTNGGSTST